MLFFLEKKEKLRKHKPKVMQLGSRAKVKPREWNQEADRTQTTLLITAPLLFAS